MTNPLNDKGMKGKPVKNPFSYNDTKQYKSIRIRPETFKIFRKHSFYQEKPMIDLIAEAGELLDQKYKEEAFDNEES